jgi:hypothetical protein
MSAEIIIEAQIKWLASRFGISVDRAKLLAGIAFETTRGRHA